MTADELIDRYGLIPHPEGGHYREIWRDAPARGGRGVGTAILFLLAAGERSHWHRVDAVEVWHHYAGGPLELLISADGKDSVRHVVSDDLAAGHLPVGIVPAGAWQAAAPLGDWVLVGCTVSPAFSFEGFELAPPGWAPGQAG